MGSAIVRPEPDLSLPCSNPVPSHPDVLEPGKTSAFQAWLGKKLWWVFGMVSKHSPGA
jgi:hypothetical protein